VNGDDSAGRGGAAAGDAAARLLHGFARACGADPARRTVFLRAVAQAPPADITRLYWTARVTLLADVRDLPRFDAVFDEWFRGRTTTPVAEASETPAPQSQGAGELEPILVREGSGRSASSLELVRRRDFPHGPPLTELRRALRRTLPLIDSRRRKAARRGRLDVRRTLRHARAGEIVVFAYRHRPPRARPILLLIDVSGSLRAHSPDFLRFAHAVVREAPRAEAFTFGTRLTRVTPMLRRRDAGQALHALSHAVTDADGGTRIGASLTAFLQDSRNVSRARGAVIVVLSDGLERGDPAEMAAAVRRLSRLGHRLIWWTPLGRDPSYRPVTRAMAAILPDLDHLAGARDLETLREEVLTLPRICA
jgi:uncharacterized protein with von Willebrand factor type A (vWA) domain